MEQEEKLKIKSEFKMFVWYVFTEPKRKIKYLFRTADNKLTPSFLIYILATLTIFLFVRDWKDPAAYLGAVAIILVGGNMIWKRKKFIHVYRIEKESKLSSDIQPESKE